jgi:hypothetical protein
MVERVDPFPCNPSEPIPPRIDGVARALLPEDPTFNGHTRRSSLAVITPGTMTAALARSGCPLNGVRYVAE